MGKPARGVQVRLQEHHQKEGEQVFSFVEIAHGYVLFMIMRFTWIYLRVFSVTDDDGRCTDLLPPVKPNGVGALSEGLYKVIFRTEEYFESTGRASFYPWVEVRYRMLMTKSQC